MTPHMSIWIRRRICARCGACSVCIVDYLKTASSALLLAALAAGLAATRPAALAAGLGALPGAGAALGLILEVIPLFAYAALDLVLQLSIFAHRHCFVLHKA